MAARLLYPSKLLPIRLYLFGLFFDRAELPLAGFRVNRQLPRDINQAIVNDCLRIMAARSRRVGCQDRFDFHSFSQLFLVVCCSFDGWNLSWQSKRRETRMQKSVCGNSSLIAKSRVICKMHRQARLNYFSIT